MEQEIRQKITERFAARARFDCSLKSFSTFRIGGNAACLVEVESVDELSWLLNFVREQQFSWRVFGKGSNLLVSDTGFDGVILMLGEFFKQLGFTSEDKTLIECGAGSSLTRLIKWCQEQGRGGAEFLFGIPGTVGGAVVMNAGAFGGEISEIITAVEYVDHHGAHRISGDGLGFGYRRFHNWKNLQDEAVVTRVWLNLQKQEPENIKVLCRDYVKRRAQKQPQGLPNAGSFFKNPAGDSAGRLIEDCGLKGYRIGGAMVSEKHANFFVNAENATSEDMVALMKHVQKRVEVKHSIKLEPEVHFIG